MTGELFSGPDRNIELYRFNWNGHFPKYSQHLTFGIASPYTRSSC